MELRELIKALNKEKNLIVGLTTLGLIIALIIYIIPPRYITSGSLFVTRNTQNSDEYFTYEGYYAQQAAVSYANSVEPLIQSIDVAKASLDKLEIEPSTYNLRKLDQDLRVKREGAQLILLELKDKDPEVSLSKWNAVSQSTIEISNEINKTSEPELSIVKLSQFPVTKMVYKNLYIYLVFGALTGFFSGIVKITFEEYLVIKKQ